MEFDEVTPGAKAEMERRVSRAMCVTPGGRSGKPVFSTPAMIQMMERTSIRALQGRLPPGFATVGYHVDVRHLGPTPLGEPVRVAAELTAVEGNKLTFAVEAYYGEKKVGTGTHRRAIIPLKAP